MTRIERDFLGEKEVPDDAYYGAQALRARENFTITGIPMSQEPGFVRALGHVKKAAAMANRDLGVLGPEMAREGYETGRSLHDIVVNERKLLTQQ